MTLPPRWSELHEDNYNPHHAELCITCIQPFHDTCSLTTGCPCCDDTIEGIAEQGNHNRFAGSEIAGDMAAPLLDPIQGIVTSETEDEPSGALKTSSWYVEADALPDAMPPAQGDVSDDMSAASNQDVSPMANMGGNPAATPPSVSAPGMAMASWNSEDYARAIHKQASDSDVYYQGYADATSGKKMDEGLANLSMDYYQGYKQGLLYNETNLQSSPANIEDIASRSHYEKDNRAPGALDHNTLRALSDLGGGYPKVGSSVNAERHISSLGENFTVNESGKVIPSMGHLMNIHIMGGDKPKEAFDKVVIQYPNASVEDVIKDYRRHIYNLNNPSKKEKLQIKLIDLAADPNLQKNANIVIKPVRICDDCGTIDPLVNNRFDSKWHSFEDEDYCPKCYNDCFNCGCETSYADPDHGPRCNAFKNGGNCACPPCGCNCHI
jgi:hypothetical protein